MSWGRYALVASGWVRLPLDSKKLFVRRRPHLIYVTQLRMVVTYLHMLQDSFTYVTGLVYICDRIRLHMWQDSFTYVEVYLVFTLAVCDMAPNGSDGLIDVTWLTCLIHMWQDSFTYVLMYLVFTLAVCDMTPNDSDGCIDVTWLTCLI